MNNNNNGSDPKHFFFFSFISKKPFIISRRGEFLFPSKCELDFELSTDGGGKKVVMGKNFKKISVGRHKKVSDSRKRGRKNGGGKNERKKELKDGGRKFCTCTYVCVTRSRVILLTYSLRKSFLPSFPKRGKRCLFKSQTFDLI